MGKLAGTWPPRPPWRLISTILIGRDAALTHAKLPVLVHLDGTIGAMQLTSGGCIDGVFQLRT